MASLSSGRFIGLSIILITIISCGTFFIAQRLLYKSPTHDIDIGVTVDYPDLSDMNPTTIEAINNSINSYIKDELDAYWEVIGTRTAPLLASIEITSSVTHYSGDPDLVSIRVNEYWLENDKTEPTVYVDTFIFNAETGEQYKESDFFLNSNMHTKDPSEWESIGTYLAVSRFAKERGYDHWYLGESKFLEDFIITNEGILAFKSLGNVGRPGEPYELLIPFASLVDQLNPCGPLGAYSVKASEIEEICPATRAEDF